MAGEGPGAEDPVVWPEDESPGGAAPDPLSRTTTGADPPLRCQLFAAHCQLSAARLTARFPVTSDLQSSRLLSTIRRDTSAGSRTFWIKDPAAPADHGLCDGVCVRPDAVIRTAGRLFSRMGRRASWTARDPAQLRAAPGAGMDSWEGMARSSTGAGGGGGSDRGSDGMASTMASGRRGMFAALRIEDLGVIGEKGTKVDGLPSQIKFRFSPQRT